MSTPRRLRRMLLPLVASVFALVGMQLVGAPTASAAPSHHITAATVCYNTSQAGQFAGVMGQAAGIWNGSESNVQLSACGSDMMVYQITGGGSYAQVYGLGQGAIYIDTEQAAQYSPLRIVAHETGHILGLPDNYNGDCSILMSGGSAGTSCTNPYPSSGEAAEVDSYFGFAPATAGQPHTYKDSWPAK
ncbi:MAG: snapalysin family zinc-dependent metalloprotease [Actinocatenispora sp.]